VLDIFNRNHDQNIPVVDDNIPVEIVYDQNNPINCSSNRDPIVINIPFIHELSAQCDNNIHNNTAVRKSKRNMLTSSSSNNSICSTMFAPTPPLRTHIQNTRSTASKTKKTKLILG